MSRFAGHVVLVPILLCLLQNARNVRLVSPPMYRVPFMFRYVRFAQQTAIRCKAVLYVHPVRMAQFGPKLVVCAPYLLRLLHP